MDIVSFDTETHLFVPGRMAPPVVCASVARIVDGKIVGELIVGKERVRQAFVSIIESNVTIAGANLPYDFCVLAEQDSSLLPAIFNLLQQGRAHDVLTAEALNAIHCGYLGQMPDGGDLRNAKGKPTKRYSLYNVTGLVLGRWDAKKNADWKESYSLLDGISVERWPLAAQLYPVDDAVNTQEVAIMQVLGRADHSWVSVPAANGGPAFEGCRYCGELITFASASPSCPKAPREPHKNLGNLPAQIEADFAFKLGACWGLRTDSERVEKLAAEVEAKHVVAVERFKKKGWIRTDGTEDQAAVRKSIASAYGATGKCVRCGGSGRITPMVQVECRGVKESGRYKKGCLGAACSVCSGNRSVLKLGNEKTCKNEYDENDDLVEAGCDGSGFDLSTAPMLPRTKNKEHPRRLGGVATDRDSLMESGDDEVADYGENEFEKSRSTYVPYLRTGVSRPLHYSPNIIVATGRSSLEDSPLHQMPRQGKERSCIRARGAWCGSLIEYYFGSTDYEAGELCSFFQFCYWLFGYSNGRDAINSTGKPGILHSDLASQVLGISLDECLVRLKAKDKLVVDARQASKPYNFGRPAGMGSPKIVLTNRKKSTGFTVCERGPAMNDGKPGYWGIRFCCLLGGARECGTTKIMEWKKRSCAPVCKACVDIVENVIGVAYLKRYPEVKDYFKWASDMIRRAREEGRNLVMAPSAVWDPVENVPRIIRERGVQLNDFSALCNNGFQGMLGDIIKDAYVAVTRECYLGVKPDGSSSPLAGCRLPINLHDEPFSELIADTAHLSGPRIAEIMVASGERIAPDVVWKAETALMRFWYKSAEPLYVDGKLVPWEPKP